MVSVTIASYNSAPYIVETLESVRNQSWKEIELIVTDDSSTDNTAELCKEWMKKNRNRFVNVALITSLKNTGVPSNVNRGLIASSGSWVKILGGDDTLRPDCITNNMGMVSTDPRIKVLFSNLDVYQDNFNPRNYIHTIPGNPFSADGIMAHDRSAESQYRMLLVCDRIHYSPSVFMDREAIFSVGCFDERFKLLEDHPLWLNLTRNGYRLFFMEKTTVNYRRHSKAINNTGNEFIVNPNFLKTNDFRKIYTYPYLPADVRFDQIFTWFVSRIFKYKWLNRNRIPNRFLLNLLTLYLNPFRYLIWLRKRMNKTLASNEFYR